MREAIKTLVVRKLINFSDENYPKILLLKGDYQSGEILSLGRDGSVCLNSLAEFYKWIPAPVMPRPGLAAAC